MASVNASPSTIPQELPRSEPRLPGPRADAQASERRERLALLQGPQELRAALLGLLLTPGSRREAKAWRADSNQLDNADELLALVSEVPAAERLPWLETLARRFAKCSTEQRQSLVETARRVMAADGVVSALDRLRWLTLRHLLGERHQVAPAAAAVELDAIESEQARQVAMLSAYLSWLVPRAPALDLELSGEPSPGENWYASVTARWAYVNNLPARDEADGDAMVRALRGVQHLPWMLRPVLLRAWVEAARALTDTYALDPDAADALRLAALLIDSPLPPELARQFVETGTD